jgi:formate-dependent nitrite reductase cytochrome c552 subunit
MRRAIFVVLLAGLVVGLSQSSARAVKPFLIEFQEKYTNKNGSAEDKAYAELVEKTQCNVCHMGNSKKMRNDYGKALNKFIKKEEQKEKEKIKGALDKAAEEKSPSGKTFGELIKEHKLPGA